jgi:hypothetical protein
MEDKTWEYMYIDAWEMNALMEKANELGEQGWEAISLTSTKQGIWSLGKHILVLKRRRN